MTRAGRGSLQLGDSWVVDGDEAEYLPPNETGYAPSAKPTNQRKSNRGSNRSPDPEFVMPPLDVDTETLASSWSESTGRSPQRLQDPRRRNPRYTSSSENRPRESPPRAKRKTNYQHLEPNDEGVTHYASMFLTWLLDILVTSLGMLKTPLSFLLSIALLVWFGIVARNVITGFIYTSLSPICHIPGTSVLNLPFCSIGNEVPTNEQHASAEFEQLMNVQSQFETVLTESAGGASLPLEMKQGEIYLRDLRQLVRHSHLRSKNELALEFDGFIETAKLASYDFSKFNSHIGRAVDTVIALSRYTSRVLDDIKYQEASRGAIATFVNENLLAPFQTPKLTESLVYDQFVKHSATMEEEIKRLISEAGALLMILGRLEERLDVIGGIARRDGIEVQKTKDQTLSELWAFFGGHRGKINKLNGELYLLTQIETRRKNAVAHVSGTLLKLQSMEASLDDLRDRVAAPELLRDKSSIPLSVHIEHIERGVERLEEQRLISRREENEVIQRLRNRIETDGNLIEG